MRIELAQNDIERSWTELVWTLSDGDMNNFNAFKASDMIDFFTILNANEKKWNKK